MRRRRFVAVVAGGLAAGLPAGATAAETTRVSVSVDRLTARVGEPLTYTVEVVHEGRGETPEPVLSPDLARSFVLEGPSTSSGFRSSFVNGRVSRESRLTYTYSITPTRPGTHTLDAHVVTGSGTKVRSNGLQVTVTGEAMPEPAPPAPGQKPTAARGEVFLWCTLDREEVFVGEQVNYAMDVYERARFVNIQLSKLPSFQDFWSEELPDGNKGQELVAGVPYRVHPGVRRALFPQRAGTLSVGAPQATVGLRRRVVGEAVSIKVKPLPANGQPQNFPANNVGRFEIKASVDRSDIKQGEPFTLKVEISGVGNVRFVDLEPLPEIAGARIYDPKVDNESRLLGDPSGRAIVGGSRRYEYLVIPQRPGTVEIPPVRLNYFDPETQEYRTAQTQTVRVEVRGQGTGGEPDEDDTADVPAGAEGSAGEELLPPIVVEPLPRTSPRPRWLTPTRFAAAMAAVPAAIVGGVAWQALTRRVRGDDTARAQAAARIRRRKLLEEARGAVPTGEGFHATLGQVLQEVAVARSGPTGVGLARPALMKTLRDRGVPGEEVDALESLLERCDAARFGVSGPGSADAAAGRAELFDEAQSLLANSALGRGLV